MSEVYKLRGFVRALVSIEDYLSKIQEYTEARDSRGLLSFFTIFITINSSNKTKKQASIMGKKVTIIGAGKLASNIVKGLIASGVSLSDIIVYGKTTMDFSKVRKLGVTTSTELSTLLDDRIVFFCVQPKHVGQLAYDVNYAFKAFEARKNYHPNLEVISVISGQSINQLAEKIHIKPTKIVTATMDTNVAYGKAIITYHTWEDAKVQDSLDLLKGLGKLKKVLTYADVLKDVTLKGAGKALDVTVARLIYRESSCGSVREFVDTLHQCFEHNAVATTAFLGWHLDLGNDAEGKLKKYFGKKGQAIELLFGKNREAFFEGVATFVNTIAALAQEENLSEDTFDLYIKDIATQDGCTEKGLGLITHINHVITDDFLRNDRKVEHGTDGKKNKVYLFFSKVHHRTTRFKSDAVASFANVQVAKGSDPVLTALAQGNYPLN